MDQISKNLLLSIAEMERWEWNNIAVARSVVGRHVYYSIARQIALNSSDSKSLPLKFLLFHPDLTDRAMRMKMRHFEMEGLIEFLPGDVDKRHKVLVPTQTLIDLVESHACTLRRTIEESTYCISKEESGFL